MGGEGSAHFPDGLHRSALMRKRRPRRHAGPPVNRAPEDRSRWKRTEEETNGSGKARDAAPEELMLAVMFVVTAVGVAFVERPPQDFLPHLDGHGGRAPEKRTRPRRPGRHRLDVAGRRPEADGALGNSDLRSNRTRFGPRKAFRSLDGVPGGPWRTSEGPPKRPTSIINDSTTLSPSPGAPPLS